jgi:hypothetical protein
MGLVLQSISLPRPARHLFPLQEICSNQANRPGHLGGIITQDAARWSEDRAQPMTYDEWTAAVS